tara:strand:+ start:1383 stop:1928 length:546 start_codon:yes stop_codon:yes gene_type:complete
MIDIILLGSSSIIVIGVCSLLGCTYKQRMTKILNELESENRELTSNIDIITNENIRLREIRVTLESSSQSIKSELEKLKSIIDMCGDTNKDAYNKMLGLYDDYKKIVDLDVRVKSIGLLMDLDTNNDFIFDKNEKETAILKLKLLFNHNNINISDSDFDNMDILKTKLSELIKNESFNALG